MYADVKKKKRCASSTRKPRPSIESREVMKAAWSCARPAFVYALRTKKASELTPRNERKRKKGLGRRFGLNKGPASQPETLSLPFFLDGGGAASESGNLLLFEAKEELAHLMWRADAM